MEFVLVGATAAGVLLLGMAFLSPPVEAGRQPMRYLLGNDRHPKPRRSQYWTHVTGRAAPKPLRVRGAAVHWVWEPVNLVKPARGAARPIPVASLRGVQAPIGFGVMPERYADGLVASLLEPARGG